MVCDAKVSIIIPTFNRRNALHRVLSSYLSQAHLREIIVVNDGSKDDTKQFVRKFIKDYPIVKLINHEMNMGQSSAKNTGILAAEGEYILIGEDDVYLQEDYVAMLLNCLNERNADLIGGRLLPWVTGSFEKAKEKAIKRKRPFAMYWAMVFDFSQNLEEDIQVPMIHSITLGRTEVYRETLFDTKYYYGSTQREDVDFHLRLGEIGRKIFFCPHTLCFHLSGKIKKGGNWSLGPIRHELYSIKYNNRFLNTHYDLLKKSGMKGNKLTYQLIHLVGRFGILFKYYWGKFH